MTTEQIIAMLESEIERSAKLLSIVTDKDSMQHEATKYNTYQSILKRIKN